MGEEVTERRLDAKRKRIRMLNEVLRELDLAVYMELLTLYYLDCSFFWLAVKVGLHGSLLMPAPDTAANERPRDETKPFLPVLLSLFTVNFALHLTYPAPAAGEDTRAYLHGGLLIDFIGQQGPTSKWALGALDVCVLFLQLLMVAVHVKRRALKKQLANTSDPATDDGAAARGQDADDEERGVLHRTDTLFDMGATDEDALLPPSSETGNPDALDILTSGQCVVGEFTLVDTLLQENRRYSYRLTRSESGTDDMPDMPDTLRRLNTLRARFGVGGG
ncbi:DUF1746-domain-containing protein [Clathrospora elynae]|uniref:DUF1746-domain-containing protein n=1 Tax=Clathrospora elynae TaxID=706981 RepID=A0A6A5SCB6_9PLEO|nr:DUF1746-domain-containing protein [Clathrospora elynae]